MTSQILLIESCILRFVLTVTLNAPHMGEVLR